MQIFNWLSVDTIAARRWVAEVLARLDTETIAIRRATARALRGLRAKLQRLEPLGFALFAGACVLWTATEFYGALREQTLHGLLWHRPEAYTEVAKHGLAGPWSAPLDDVFIHFDFARALARGHPFEWSEGNGYSSGGTSLLYPLVLAVGYRLGWRGLALMQWAALVACVSVFGTVLAARRLFRGLPRWTTYLAPLAVLGVGGVSWALFSGMEIALLVAMWAGALVAWDDLVESASAMNQTERPGLIRGALRLGIWTAAVVATRPEGIVALTVFGGSIGWIIGRQRGLRAAAVAMGLSTLPGVVVLMGQATLNLAYTGTTSAAGALAKLEIYNAKLSAWEVYDSWLFFLKYQVLRVSHFHLSSTSPVYGWVLWSLLPFGLIPRSTRRYAILLISSMLLWTGLVALNGQVRWQNERYSMPAVLWFMLASMLGAAVLFAPCAHSTFGGKPMWLARAAFALTALGIFAWQQEARFRQQLWFFGRASRNIFEQQIQVGHWLRSAVRPPPRRIMVGDAGAIPYISDLPALDLVGLGGYHGLPFAQATRLSVGAGIELLEHLAPEERPELMALYPSWWGELPAWFGARAVAEAYARGNVICGGWTKVIYAADWSSLDLSPLPFSVRDGEVVVDEVDVADLVSEKAHDVRVEKVRQDAAEMRLLADPRLAGSDLWDAGRILEATQSLSFTAMGLSAVSRPRLVLRTAPYESATLDVFVNGKRQGGLDIRPHDGWMELDFPLRSQRSSDVRCTLRVLRGTLVLHHAWVVGSAP